MNTNVRQNSNPTNSLMATMQGMLQIDDVIVHDASIEVGWFYNHMTEGQTVRVEREAYEQWLKDSNYLVEYYDTTNAAGDPISVNREINTTVYWTMCELKEKYEHMKEYLLIDRTPKHTIQSLKQLAKTA